MKPLTDRFAFRLWIHAARWTPDGQCMIVVDKNALLHEMRKLGGRSQSIYSLTTQLRFHGWFRARQSSMLMQYIVPWQATVWTHSFLRRWSSVELALESTPQQRIPPRPSQSLTDAAVPQWNVDAQAMEAVLTLCGLGNASFTAVQPEYLIGLTPEESLAISDGGNSHQAEALQSYGEKHGEAESREEIALLSEMAEFHVCKLELEDLLMLSYWYSVTGSYCLPCHSCRVGGVELREQQQEHDERARI